MEKKYKNLWFGSGPSIINNKINIPDKCNPFDILLNDGDWYQGEYVYPELAEMLRKYWFGHFAIMENVFVWKDRFDYIVIYNNGKIIDSRN